MGGRWRQPDNTSLETGSNWSWPTEIKMTDVVKILVAPLLIYWLVKAQAASAAFRRLVKVDGRVNVDDGFGPVVRGAE